MAGLLHTHSQYSWDSPLDSYKAAQRVAALGYSAYALTDHASVAGLVEHEKACKAAGIKPLLGVEIYFQPVIDKDAPRTHLTLIARNNQGLENLYQMQSEAAKPENFYHVPVVTFETLEKFSKGVIVLTGCLSSYSSKLILDGNNEALFLFMEKLQAVVEKGSLFLELQPFSVYDTDTHPDLSFLEFADGSNGPTANRTHIDKQQVVNLALIAIHRNTGLPLVMTGDSHYVNKDELTAYGVSLSVARGGKQDSMAGYENRHIQSVDEMWDGWQAMMSCNGMTTNGLRIYFDEAMGNTDVVAFKCDATTINPPQLPVLGTGLTTSELVRRVAKGLEGKGLWIDAYKQRARYELERIIKKGFVDYMLMVSNEFNWYQEQNIGAVIRGSAAGSVVCFALGMSNVDPLKIVDVETDSKGFHVTYGFDRFLGENRNELPDIDIDLPVHQRDRAVHHFQQKFSGLTAQISTFGRWQAKNLSNKLKDTFSFSEADVLLLKRTLTEMGVDANGAEAHTLYCNKELAGLEKRYPGLIGAVCLLHNTVNYTGTHPSAIVITRDPIETQLALVSVAKPDKTRILQACYDMDSVEIIGGVKVDFLGNAGLSAISLAQEDAGVSFCEHWLTDAATLQAFVEGDTAGINQFEKSDATNMIKQIAKGLNSFTFEDLIAVNAINRPGSAKVSDYIKGETDITSRFCQDSHGVMIYQEQVMKLLRYAGFTWEQVSKFIKSNKKKVAAPDLRKIFVLNMTNLGHPTKEMAAIWTRLEGRYLFNKSHAASYALMAMQEMFLKVHYPFSWFLGLLTFEKELTKRRIYASDAVQHKVFLVPPHINGDAHYRKIFVKQNGELKPFIQEGLLHLDGIGEVTAQAIEQERRENGDYTSLDDFKSRFSKKRKDAKESGGKFKNPATNGTLEILEKYGCVEFDPVVKARQILNYNRMKMQQVVYIQ